MFVKLGVKTLLVVQDGGFIGMLHKKTLLVYLRDCERASV
jgi:hypothetical protein